LGEDFIANTEGGRPAYPQLPGGNWYATHMKKEGLWRSGGVGLGVVKMALPARRYPD